MEWIFLILIPKRILKKIVFHEVTQMEDYYQNLLCDEIKVVDYVILRLELDLIYDIYAYVNISDNQEVINNSPIICLINHLYEQRDSLCLINEIVDEITDDKFIINNADEAVDALINSLKWSAPKSTIIIKISLKISYKMVVVQWSNNEVATTYGRSNWYIVNPNLLKKINLSLFKEKKGDFNIIDPKRVSLGRGFTIIKIQALKA